MKQTGTEIATLIRQINATLNHKLREAFKDHSLTPPQIMVIHLLAENEQLKVSDISKKMSLSNSTVSGILDRLEKQNYILRVRNDIDKRIVHIIPSEHMKELQQEFHQTVTYFLEAIVKDATEQEIDEIKGGLRTLRGLLDGNNEEQENREWDK